MTSSVSPARRAMNAGMLDVSIAIRNTVKATIEEAAPFFSSHLLLAAVCSLALLQVLPALAGPAGEPPLLAAALDSKAVATCTGFSLGFVALVLVDLAFDALAGRIEASELWVSRSVYVWLTFADALLLINHTRVRSVGLVYATLHSASLVFFIGRACVDLCLHDQSSTFHMRSCLALLVVLSASLLLGTLDDHTNGPLRAAAQALALLYCAMLLFLAGAALVKGLGTHSGSLRSRVFKLTHGQCITSFSSAALLFFSVPLALLPTATGYSPAYVCGDVLLRLVLVTSLALFPSLSLKHKSFSLEADLNLRSLFVKNVAHEIRTPLNIAISGLDIMRRAGGDASAEDREMVMEIMDSCEVAVSILDDLLSYEKLSSGVMALDRRAVNVRSFVRTAASLFDIQARSKGLALRILEDEPLVEADRMVELDYGKMTQVLRNFVSNAIKFTDEGGQVSVRAFERPGAALEGPRVVVQVVDSGVGMTGAQLKRIFAEIVQFDAARLQGGKGSGIGLWVSKQIVDLHGGRVRVLSQGLGCGCVFELEMPLSAQREAPVPNLASTAPAAQTAAPLRPSHRVISRLIDSHHSSSHSSKVSKASKASRAPVFGAGGELSSGSHPSAPERRYFASEKADPARGLAAFRGLRLLIVDDSMLNRKYLRRLIAPCHFRVEEAGDGLACLDKVRQARQAEDGFDFVLMDWEMPRLGGPQATEQLRRSGFEGAVVGITGNSLTDDIQAFLNSGADDVLVKPVTYNQLITCFREVLQRRRRPVVEGYDDEDEEVDVFQEP